MTTIASIAENTLCRSIDQLQTLSCNSEVIKMLEDGLYDIRREEVLMNITLEKFTNAIMVIANSNQCIRIPYADHYNIHSHFLKKSELKCIICLKYKIEMNWFGKNINELIEWSQRRYIREIETTFAPEAIAKLKKEIRECFCNTQKKENLLVHFLNHVEQSCEKCLMYKALNIEYHHPIVKKVIREWLGFF